MGYFSMKSIELSHEGEQMTHSDSEERLRRRIEDLQCRLEELKETAARYKGWETLTADAIRYTVPESFIYIADVETAIRFASEDLNHCSTAEFGKDCFLQYDRRSVQKISILYQPELLNKRLLVYKK